MTAPLGNLPDDLPALPAAVSDEVQEMLDLLYTVPALSAITLQARLGGEIAVQVKIHRTRKATGDGFVWEATARDGVLPSLWTGRSMHPTPEAAFDAAVRTVAMQVRQLGLA